MPPLVVPDACQVTVTGTCLGQPWSSVYGLNVESFAGAPLTESGAAALAALVKAYYDELAPLRATSWQVDQYTVTDLQEDGGPQFTFALETVGTGIGSPMPPDMAICVSWLTNRRGGSYRGRTFHNGFTEEGMDNGRLGSDELGDEQAAAQAFIDSFDPNTGLAVISRKLLVATPVVVARVNDVFDHQTRRRFPQ